MRSMGNWSVKSNFELVSLVLRGVQEYQPYATVPDFTRWIWMRAELLSHLRMEAKSTCTTGNNPLPCFTVKLSVRKHGINSVVYNGSLCLWRASLYCRQKINKRHWLTGRLESFLIDIVSRPPLLKLNNFLFNSEINGVWRVNFSGIAWISKY